MSRTNVTATTELRGRQTSPVGVPSRTVALGPNTDAAANRQRAAASATTIHDRIDHLIATEPNPFVRLAKAMTEPWS